MSRGMLIEFSYSIFASVANHHRPMQELEAGAGSGTRRDQAHTKCAIGHRTIYGGNRSKVCLLVSGPLGEIIIC